MYNSWNVAQHGRAVRFLFKCKSACVRICVCLGFCYPHNLQDAVMKLNLCVIEIKLKDVLE